MTLTDDEISVFYDAGIGRVSIDSSDYVVTRNKNIDNAPKEGGSVSIEAGAAPSGSSIYLRANPRADRDLVWSDTGSRLKNLNEEQDRVVLRLLVAGEILGRAVVAKPGSYVPSPQDVIDAAEAISTRALTSLENVDLPEGDFLKAAGLDLIRVNASGFAEFGRPLAFSNIGSYADRGAPQSQTEWWQNSPTGPGNLNYTVVVGTGDISAPFRPITPHYYVVGDHPTILASQRPAMYGLAISMRPRFDRNTVPVDDMAALILANEGTGRMTEILYIGRNPNPIASDAGAVFGNDAHADVLIYDTGAHVYGWDGARQGTTDAIYTQAMLRAPLGARVAVARNAADTADLELLGTNSSDQMMLGGKVAVPWTDYTPTVTPSSGAFTSAGPVLGECRYRRLFGSVDVRAVVTVSNKGTGAGELRVSLPFAATKGGLWIGRETLTDTIVRVRVAAGETFARITGLNGGDVIANGNFYDFSISYEG